MKIELPLSVPCPEGFIEISTFGDVAEGRRAYIPGPDLVETIEDAETAPVKIILPNGQEVSGFLL